MTPTKGTTMRKTAAEKAAANDTIENADGVTPEHELEAAVDEPAGSTEHSGASAGIKAEGQDDPGSHDKPKATEKAERQAQDIVDEVRKQQYEVMKRNMTNADAPGVRTVFANDPDKGDPKSLTIAYNGTDVTLIASTSGEMVFDREHYLDLMRAVSGIGASL